MPRKVKAPLERKDTDIHMAQRNVYERKHKSPRKRVDSLLSNEELEVAEEASGSYHFVFPPPPPPPIPCVSRRSVSASPYLYTVSDSDSQSDSGRGAGDHSSPIAIRHPLLTFRGYQSDGSPVALHSLPRFLPPIGVFWDIENCQVPKGRSAITVAQVIRDRFFTGYREAEFIVVCDVKKENSQVIQELNDAQVNLIHVASTCKNAADEKLRQSIRRFADIHGSPAAIILISGDINFAADLTDLKHRKKMHVILLHNSSASEALIFCASEHHNFSNLMEDLPMRGTVKSAQPVDVVVSNLPEDKDQARIKNRLKQLSGNCGGRVISLSKTLATLRFSSIEFANRAQKRMEGEDVFGRKITVNHMKIVDTTRKDSSPVKMQSARKLKYNMREEEDIYGVMSRTGHYNSTPAGLNVLSSIQIPNSWNSNNSRSNSPTYGNSRDRTPEGYRRIKGVHRVSMSDENSSIDAEQEQRWKKCRTPSPYLDTDQELERYFHPISTPKPVPMELVITNLDQSLDAKELRRILLGVFREHVMVMHLSVFTQSDGNYAAHVKVPSLQDAQYAISQLHRRKVGYKRILISYANITGPSPQLIRSQIVSLLLEVPGHRLPLFKFRELFESRYLASISISDMYKLRDVCLITEESTGRMVTLNPDHRNTPSPCNPQDGQQMELPYCRMHSRKPAPDKGWAEQEVGTLPNVRVGLKMFALHIHTLLQTHNGSLPLPSLPICYEAQFEKLPMDETGVPLEHLVSCLPGIEIYQGVGCVKYLRWLKSKANGEVHAEEIAKCVSPPLATQLALLSRELVDLLKTAPHCQLLFNRFIPAYHHHFGRQCRVADYGFTKLIDLMEALPHIVQVMGEGNRRVITLSHRSQVRRFISDLLRVLKSQASKQVALSEFPIVYQKVLGRTWDIVDYGVCDLRDLLSEVSENTVVMSQQDNDTIISIPKREQTPEEREKTKLFAAEVVELLRHAPQCSMQFNKFIPAYHHHYGHQCRVADYGFAKLIELFEAIPHVAKVEDDGEGERRVSLTLEERLRVLGEQVSALMRLRRPYMTLPTLSTAFLRNHGYALRPDNYECNSLEQLMLKLHHTVTLMSSPAGLVVAPVDRTRIHHLSMQVRRILIEAPGGRLSAREFVIKFQSLYQQILDLQQLERELTGIVQVTESDGELVVELTPIQMFARNVYHLLYECDGQLPQSAFESAYLRKYGVACQPAQYGQTTIMSLLHSIPETVLLRGRANKKILTLNKELAVVGLAFPANMSKQNGAHGDDAGNEETENHTPSPPFNAKANVQEDPVADKFLKSILSYGNGSQFLFESPDTPKPPLATKALENGSKVLSRGSMWGGASPPQYSPYCYSSAFSPHMGGTVPQWPNLSPPPFHFPSGCIPHVVPPDPSELPLPQMNGIRPEEDKNASGENTPNRTRRKRRLAAQFNTPIQM